MVTVSGLLLIAVSFGIGTAAYNAANNILFITLSLLLACLILSGMLSWLNFRDVTWQLHTTAPVRVGQDAVATLGVHNGKAVVPTYGLWFEMTARAVDRRVPAKAETTFTARGIDVRAALAQAGQAEVRERLFLRQRLDPGNATELEWIFKPQHRGVLRLELESVGSLFPFGFLKKHLATELEEEVIVWPAPVEYRRMAVAALRRPAGGERVARAGSGGDLLALRRYQMGDSHRLIHWKASARTRQLLVRQFAAESTEGFSLWLRTDASGWRPDQFELLVSFAATLAEDLFRADKLTRVALDADAPLAVRRVRDLETFLDRLALVEANEAAAPSSRGGKEPGEPARGSFPLEKGNRKNLITFAPDGPRGVAAYVDGNKIAAA